VIQPVLTTARLVLRPFTVADAPLVQRYAGDALIADTTLNIPHPYLDGVAEGWIASQPGAWERRRAVVFAVTPADEPLVGAIALELALEHRRGELGYWIGVPFWGRGYATEAVRAVLRFGFETLSLDRIHAAYLARNPASGRVLAGTGFRPEGRLRSHIVKRGCAEDLELAGLLRSEWTTGLDSSR
jgi:[ribosomal protein S5]-alanine N-acetyltransferase